MSHRLSVILFAALLLIPWGLGFSSDSKEDSKSAIPPVTPRYSVQSGISEPIDVILKRSLSVASAAIITNRKGAEFQVIESLFGPLQPGAKLAFDGCTPIERIPSGARGTIERLLAMPVVDVTLNSEGTGRVTAETVENSRPASNSDEFLIFIRLDRGDPYSWGFAVQTWGDFFLLRKDAVFHRGHIVIDSRRSLEVWARYPKVGSREELVKLVTSLPLTKIPNLVDDPYQYVWLKEGSVSGMTRFFYDLNGDGFREFFIGSNALAGNGGGPFWIFSWRPDLYAILGDVSLAEGGLQIMETKHNGFRDIKSYGHLSASKGTVTTYQFDGKQYKPTENRTVDSSRFPEEIVPTRVEMEQSGLVLNWPTTKVEKVGSPDIAKKLAVEALRSFGLDASNYDFQKIDVHKTKTSWSVTFPRKDRAKPPNTEIEVNYDGRARLLLGK